MPDIATCHNPKCGTSRNVLVMLRVPEGVAAMEKSANR